MARTPLVTRESIPEEHRAAFDEYVQRHGGVVPTGGPGSAMLNAPEVANRALRLAAYLRGETSLAPGARHPASGHAGSGSRERLPDHLERSCSPGSQSRFARRVD